MQLITNREKLALQGAKVLTPNGWIDDITVLIEDGKFIDLDRASKPSGYLAIDVSQLWMLPGIVDIHGDGFERTICPRPGIHFPIEMAIVENDRNLLAAGITTFYYSITDSFEPGLRSRDTARQILNFVLGEGKTKLCSDSRIHIRHEQGNTQKHDELSHWLETRQIHLLSLNDHLQPIRDEDAFSRYARGLKQRLKLPESEIRSLIAAAIAEKDRGWQQVEELVELAHQCHIPLASHDDDSEAKVALSVERKVAIAEFPGNISLAAQIRQSGAAVLMGAPNLIRGGSHVGYMSVEAAAKAEVLDCLCSDYHYPSLFHAPFKMARMGLTSFPQAWKLVSENPAKAANIGDKKGAIAPGYDADFLLVKPDNDLPSAIASVYVKGREVAKYSL